MYAGTPGHERTNLEQDLLAQISKTFLSRRTLRLFIIDLLDDSEDDAPSRLLESRRLDHAVSFWVRAASLLYLAASTLFT